MESPLVLTVSPKGRPPNVVEIGDGFIVLRDVAQGSHEGQDKGEVRR
jgi:hypothetical protein